MGYACPVCDAPQADGEHLANHLAFTAMLHGGDHEAWLEEHVPGWDDRNPAALAGEVDDLAEEIDHDTVFEDTSERGRPDVGHAHGGGHAHGRTVSPGDLDPEARRILEEAMELTRERRSHDETEE